MPRRWGNQRVSDSTLTVGIKQGVGATVPRPFGSGSSKPKNVKLKKKKQRGGPRYRQKSLYHLGCWNAFAEPHLPLPRAVAPYTVIRTTAIWNPTDENNRRFCLFGPFSRVSGDGEQWSTQYAHSSNVPLASLRSSTSCLHKWNFGSMGGAAWKAASVVPAAFSIQIMNSEAIQGSHGMVYIGRCKNKVNLSEGDNSTSFQDLCDNLVSYSNPRMCSAGKLALRGVHVDAVPNNMNALAKFATLHQEFETTGKPTTASPEHQDGFNPIFIYNPNAVDLQVLVCCEWRVRFDPSNPAYAACRMHTPSTDRDWADSLKQAAAMGNGAVDIVETVARLGRAVGAI